MPFHAGKHVKFAKVDVAAAATTAVIAAVTGQKITILAYSITLAAAGTVKFVTDTAGTPVDLSGAQDLAQGQPTQGGYGPLMQGSESKDVGLTTAGAGATAEGWIAYYLETP